MKKIFLVVAAVAFFAAQGIAQDLNFGAKGGVNFSNFIGDDADNVDQRTSFHLGLVAEYMVNDQFAIQPELLFSAQGATYDIAKIESEAKLSYINIPVMFKYYVAPGFSLNAGPQIGFLVDSKIEVNDKEKDTDDMYKTVDFGLGFGAAYKFDSNVFIEGRYNLGLTKIMDEGDAKVKNGVIQLSVGYMF